MLAFIKGESFPFAVTTDKMPDTESFTHVIRRKHHCSPLPPPMLPLPKHKSLKNNKCCKCSISFPRGRINGLTTIMFLACYLLIFTVVTTSFVTSQPVSVTNLQARNKLMMKMKTGAEKAGEGATIPIQMSTPSSSSSYPSFSFPTSSFYLDDDSTKNGNASFSTTADVPTGKHIAKHKTPEKSPWSTVIPPLGFISVSSKLSLDQVENSEEGEETTIPTAAEFSENNIGNHADSPLSSSSSPLTQTLTEKYMGHLPLNNGPLEEKEESSGKYVENKEMEIKVGLARDKGKVMVTDDVKGSSSPFPSSSKVNPVVLSFSSGNSHAAAANNDDDDVDKAVVKEKKGIKVNIIMLKDKEEEEMEEERKKSKIPFLFHSKLNLLSNLNKSERFMSTTKGMMEEEEEATTLSSFQKQDEMIVTRESSNRQKERTKTGSDVKGEYANDVNNHVNFVDENYNQPRTEIQQGFDTDYSNKRRDFTSSSSPDSNSANTPGISVKSTRYEVAEKMNISVLSWTFPEVQVDNEAIEKDKNKENEKEEEEDKVHQKMNKKSDNMSQSYNDFSNDSPVVAVVTGDEEEDNWKSPSTKTSPLLMNKWITTLVKLSQCRANCLDQAGIHQWDSLQSDLLVRLFFCF